MDIKHVAQLAQLKLTPEEETLFTQQLESILQSFQQLQKVDTSKVEPLISPTEQEQFYREDKAVNWDQREVALEAAPELMGQLFKVPPVV